jgi:hypothetical protein
MDDLKTFCCQNPDCPDYGRRGLDNLRVGFRNGPNKQGRVLACRTCQQRFSQRKGTALYRCKLPEDKALSVLQHLQESCGVRQTSRLVGVNKNTVVRLAVVAGRHAKAVHDDVVAFSPRTREVQFDEKWSFVTKKEKHCAADDVAARQQGDNWDHVAFDPEHRLVVSVVPGKRTEDKTRQLVQDFRERTGGRLMNLMTSDENPAYRAASSRPTL